jgi:cbb3-type cytochrome oxidase cytochrome c subunit
MTSLRKFVFGLAAAFGLPWLILIVIPVLKGQKLAPESYDKDRDGIEGVYPGSGIYRQGQLVYLREGCVQCHTQMIRPSYIGIMDGWKKGWGSDQSAQPEAVVRASTMRDYLGEPVAPLGIQRNGPDLANLGYRATDAKALYVKLYAPQSGDSRSTMPSFRHLFKVQKIQAGGSADALRLPKPFAPKKGYEVVPTDAARELVKYLMSLKKDAPIPGQVAEAEAKK